MPAPTSLSWSDCSKTWTSMPRLSKASAAVNPAMPAPTTTTFFDAFIGNSTPDEKRSRWPTEVSLGFQARRFYHRGPAWNLRCDEICEVPRRSNSRIEAKFVHAGDHLRGLQRFVDRGIELFNDVGGCSGGRPHAGPEFQRQLVESELLQSGHIRQIGIAHG